MQCLRFRLLRRLRVSGKRREEPEERKLVVRVGIPASTRHLKYSRAETDQESMPVVLMLHAHEKRAHCFLTEVAHRASLPIGFPQRSPEGRAVKGEALPPRKSTNGRSILIEPTGEKTDAGSSRHRGEDAGDTWKPWEARGPEPTPPQSQSRDKDCWPREAHS
ncbi:hypothetical protein NDU88_000513 [Pleurodeles waltl]|uniref:Uncharacterized protein n=1 Tax=Pleurodeles waltl TaxID=8319 RepID=A0AAV7TF76_PLEWA|nr:hypothetical protein NDU88_000513 [Pleurodeles waltl]